MTLGTTADRTLANAIDLANNATFDSGSHSLTLSGVVSGAGIFEKTGSGTVTLSGANTFTGGLTVTAGTLATTAVGRLASSLAPSVASGATLSLGGDQTLTVITGSGTVDIAAGTLTVGSTAATLVERSPARQPRQDWRRHVHAHRGKPGLHRPARHPRRHGSPGAVARLVGGLAAAGHRHDPDLAATRKRLPERMAPTARSRPGQVL